MTGMDEARPAAGEWGVGVLPPTRTSLGFLRRAAAFIIVVTFCAAAAAWDAAELRSPVYRASAQLLLTPSNTLLPGGAAGASIDVASQVIVLDSRPVAEGAAQHLGEHNPDLVMKAVTVVQQGSSNVVQVSADSHDPKRARDMANAVTQAYSNQLATAAVNSLQGSVDKLDRMRDGLRTRITDLDRQIALPSGQGAAGVSLPPAAVLQAERDAAVSDYQALTSSLLDLQRRGDTPDPQVTVVSQAVAPPSPIAPRPLRDALLGGLAGLVLGTLLALLRERLRDRVHEPTTVEQVLHAPVVMDMPVASLKVADARRDDPLRDHTVSNAVLEAAHSLRLALQHGAPGRTLQTVLVAAAEPGERADAVGEILAIAYARSGHRTLLVVADPAGPAAPVLLEALAEVTASLGLTGLLSSGALPPTDETARGIGALPTALPGLSVLPYGGPIEDPVELLGSGAWQQFMEQAAASADIVVLVAPALLSAAGTAVLSSAIDGVLLVVVRGQTHRSALRHATALLDMAGISLLGAALISPLSRHGRDAVHHSMRRNPHLAERSAAAFNRSVHNSDIHHLMQDDPGSNSSNRQSSEAVRR